MIYTSALQTQTQKICQDTTFLLKHPFHIVNSANFKKRDINAGHLYQGLDQSTEGFFMFAGR